MPDYKLTSQPTYPESLKRASYPACGRLIILQSITGQALRNMLTAEENFQGFTSINFPAMPDAIELARRAEYTVASPYGFPDGIHIYKGTQPLKIPFSFKLHFADTDYCPKGAKTLLEVAGILEALVVPFGPESVPAAWGAEAEKGNPIPGDDATIKTNAKEPTAVSATAPQNIFPPATCYLELIRTEHDSVGLACIGYVEDVRVRLLGPWMRGKRFTQNLPTAAEYEFTFVHHPGHGNAFRASARVEERQAYAQTVKERLFNTVGLITDATNYTGFGDAAAAQASGQQTGEFVPGGGQFGGHGAGGSWDTLTDEQKQQEERDRIRILNSKGFMR